MLITLLHPLGQRLTLRQYKAASSSVSSPGLPFLYSSSEKERDWALKFFKNFTSQLLPQACFADMGLIFFCLKLTTQSVHNFCVQQWNKESIPHLLYRDALATAFIKVALK